MDLKNKKRLKSHSSSENLSVLGRTSPYWSFMVTTTAAMMLFTKLRHKRCVVRTYNTQYILFINFITFIFFNFIGLQD
uniref:Uncharacterized protein n=1 Tax=Lepeophtheirus salmonis TaxID=72036 RepID=A0A0K2UED5_LEPSM